MNQTVGNSHRNVRPYWSDQDLAASKNRAFLPVVIGDDARGVTIDCQCGIFFLNILFPRADRFGPELIRRAPVFQQDA